MSRDDTEQLTATLNQKAMVSLESNNFNTALSFLHQANYILKNKKLTDSVVQLKCTTLNNLGCVYKRLEKPRKALLFLNEALHLSSRFSPSIDTSSIHLNISSIKSLQSLHEEALFHALSSLKLCSTNFTSLKITPLLSSYYQAACEFQFLHKLKQAKKYFSQGFELALKHLGRSHQITLKFFKSVHDKNLRGYDQKVAKKTVLKPIVEKVKRTENKSTEPRVDLAKRVKVQSYSSSPVGRTVFKSNTVGGQGLIPSKLQNQITYIGNTLNVMKKRIDLYSGKITKEDGRRPATPSSMSSKQEVKNYRVKAGLIVQKTVRMWKDKKKYLDIRRKVKKIQIAYRKWRDYKHLKGLEQSITNVSQQFNKEILKNYWENHRIEKVNNGNQTDFRTFQVFSMKIEPAYKSLNFFTTLIRLQRSIKRFLYKKKIDRAAKTIQKFFRMYRVRKRYCDVVRVETRFQRGLKQKAKSMKEVNFKRLLDLTIKSKKHWNKVLDIN